MTCTLSDEEEDLDNTSRSLSSSNLSSSSMSRIKSGRETSSWGEVFPMGGAGIGRTTFGFFFGAGGFFGNLRFGFAPPKEAEEKTPWEVEGLGSGSHVAEEA